MLMKLLSRKLLQKLCPTVPRHGSQYFKSTQNFRSTEEPVSIVKHIFLAVGGSNLHLVGCGREEKPHRRPTKEESPGGFASVVSLFKPGGAKASRRGI